MRKLTAEHCLALIDEGDFGQQSVAPQLKLSIQFRGQARHLAGGDLHAAELFHDGGDAPGGNALEIHFGDGDLEGPICAATLFKETALEWLRTGSDLWNIEVELAEGGLETAVFEAVGLSIPGLAAFVGSDFEVLGAFEDHGGIGEHFCDEWNALKNAVLKKGVDRFVAEGIVRVFGHGWCLVRF